MRKFTLALAPAFVLAASLAAYAQEKPITTTKSATDTVRINLRGKLVLDYVERNANLSEFVDTGDLGPVGQTSTGQFEGFIAMGFDVELSDKVSVVLEIGTRRADNTVINPWSEDTGTAGTGAAEEIIVREARASIVDFLAAGLRLDVGILNWGFDVDGRGGSLFNPRQAQSLLRTAVDGPRSLATVSSQPDVLDPVGVMFVYEREAFRLDVALLPAAIESGESSDDESIYAASGFYKFDDKGSRVGVLLGLFSANEPGHGMLIDFGGGLVLNSLVQNLSLSAEIHVQFGEVTDAGAGTDAGGMALLLSGQYTLEGGIVVGLIITYLSGDDNAGDGDVESFISYEDISDLAILEDMYYGFDVDTNYLAIKGHGSIPLSVGGGKNNLILSAILGFAKLNEENAAGEDALGIEVDFRVRYEITKQVALHALLGFLTGSDVLEDEGAVADADDSAVLFAVGAELGF